MQSLIPCARCGLQAVEQPRGKFPGLRLFRCPVGHTSLTKRLSMKSVRLVGTEFRKTSDGEVWHFLSLCSQWPSKIFVSVQCLASEAELCDECLAKSEN